MSTEHDYTHCAWCDDSLETPSVKGKAKDIGGGRRMHDCCYAVYRDTLERVAGGELKLEEQGEQQLAEIAQVELDSMWVVAKANVADDDSQPYVSYSFMTENGASIELAAAKLFASQEEAQHNISMYCVRVGGFRPVKYPEAQRDYESYLQEAEEFWNGQHG